METSSGSARIAPQKTVAEALRNGRFSLFYSLRCAKDVAEAVRELHESGRIHGAIGAEAVLLNSSGAELLPAKRQPNQMVAAADIAAFGALLYEMAAGEKVSPAVPLSLPFEPVPGEERVHEAVIQLVSRCLASALS